MERTHVITCRLDERDYEKLTQEALERDLNRSDYLRLLIRLPYALKSDADRPDAIVADCFIVYKLERQIQKLGYLFNQGIRALNTIALKLRHGVPANETLIELGEKANVYLSFIGERIDEAEADIKPLSDASFVFLDTKRRKPS